MDSSKKDRGNLIAKIKKYEELNGNSRINDWGSWRVTNLA